MNLIVCVVVDVVSGTHSVESEPRFELIETCDTGLRLGTGTRSFTGGLWNGHLTTYFVCLLFQTVLLKSASLSGRPES